MELIKYDTACRALAEARTVDEVKEISNRAQAIRAYARQACNRQLEIDACEIKVRAERRLGEMLIEFKREGHFTQGMQAPGKPQRFKLAELKISGNLSVVAQNLALVAPAKFENEIATWRQKSSDTDRIEMPLQDRRRPSIRGYRERIGFGKGRKEVNSLDSFVGLDGRKVSFWKIAELDRLEAATERQLKMISAIKAAMPIANPDPQSHLLEVFDHEALEALLRSAVAGIDVPRNNPVSPIRTLDSDLRIRECRRCGKPFIPSHPNADQRKTGRWGLYCSRSCSSSWARQAQAC